MSKNHVQTVFRGKTLVFHSKKAKTFDMDDEEQRAKYEHWTRIYKFMRDITDLLGGDDK